MSIIAAAQDKMYRNAIVRAAGLASTSVQSDIERLLQGHPDPGGAEHAVAVLNVNLEPMLKKSVRIVEAMDHFFPGFKNWLGESGWGNDHRLIALLCAWQEEAERKKWLHKSKPN